MEKYKEALEKNKVDIEIIRKAIGNLPLDSDPN